MHSLIADGDFVILVYGEEGSTEEKHRRIVQVRSATSHASAAAAISSSSSASPFTCFRIGEHFVSTSALIGLPWGVRLVACPDGAGDTAEGSPARVRLQVLTDSLHTQVRGLLPTHTIEDTASNEDLAALPSSTGYNRGIADARSNLTLTDAQLQASRQAYRREPLRYIAGLTSASSTFGQRIEAAQHKYVQRKARKHVLSVRLMRPTPYTLCDTLCRKASNAALPLRADSLALVLHHAGVWAGSRRILVAEERAGGMGLVTAACAARMMIGEGAQRVHAGDTAILAFYWGSESCRGGRAHSEAVRILGLPRALSEDADASQGESEAVRACERLLGVPLERVASVDDDSDPWWQWVPDVVSGCARYPSWGDRPRVVSRALLRQWLRNRDGGNEALIVASAEAPTGTMGPRRILEGLLPRLSPGCPFVVWSPWLEPLADLHADMVRGARVCRGNEVGSAAQPDGDAGHPTSAAGAQTDNTPFHRSAWQSVAQVKLVELFRQQHQFLDGRTHPHLTDSPSGGFVLHGFKMADGKEEAQT
ncbi:hypothetical protein CDCA_CDCA02G0742 [Cyanidium caldarium]|uniref:tRNA (adenine(58)-N(1))-methyltransferase non-catalytic subunit TRM6 n=1 Tax=Cyanidium caldarium TaxID=2771 RepID=A0AAV9IQR9_CYACA|nr:hypothetical protein CDCA_CDCA02G0742 [Cyanidium caldarium]